LPSLAIASDTAVTIASTQARWVAVRVQAPYDVAPAGSHAIRFKIVAQGDLGQVAEKSVFIVPH
jgi:IG-like fold at C-terminal of FixG, putative oxidoreductase